MAANVQAMVSKDIANLREMVGPKHTPVRVFLFGEPGMGKSSFCGTLMKAFLKSEYFKLRPGDEAPKPGSSSSTVTIRFGQYELPGTNIKLCDTWGWEIIEEKENYNELSFRTIMLGRHDRSQELTPNGKIPERDSDVGKVGVVIFFLPFKNNDKYAKFAKYYKICKELSIATVFVVSKIDELFPELKDMTSIKMHESKQFLAKSDELKKALMAALQSNENTDDQPTVIEIFPLCGYTEIHLTSSVLQQENPCVEEVALKVLRVTVEAAKRGRNMSGRIKIQKYRWNPSTQKIGQMVVSVRSVSNDI